jgi:hypothetical protein
MDYTTLITSEHRDKPKFAALVGLLANTVGDIGAAIQSLPQAFDLDVAVGKQLDIVGQWVGQSRTVTDVLIVGFFGFSDDIVALPFGEQGNPSIGGRFYEEGEAFSGTSVLSDPEYRTILRAKIVRNQYDGTADEIALALQYIFNAHAYIRDPGTMSLQVVVNSNISLVGQSLLTNFDLLPRPTGVSIDKIIYSPFSAEAQDVASAHGTL